MTERSVTRLASPAGEPVLEVENLVVTYPSGLRAVDGAALALSSGEVLGLVGASGSGKSTLAHAALRLVPVTSGSVRAFGEDITCWGPRRLRSVRRRMQIVFQDVDGSLNPQMPARQLIEEPLLVHGASVGERRAAARRIAGRVGLDPDALDRRPHRFSGGQRQRIALARALILEPEVLVCDEPFSSLDLAVQAQVVDVLADLRAALGLSILFITHDLALARHLCDRVAVMETGRIVETSSTEDLFLRPRHVETQRLLRASRSLASRSEEGARGSSDEAPATSPPGS